MNIGNSDLVKKVLERYKPILALGCLGGIVGGLVGQYALTGGSLQYEIVGGLIGLLIGYAIGSVIKNKTVLQGISSSYSMINIILSALGILGGFGGAVASFAQHEWFSLGCSVLLAIACYGMLRVHLSKRGGKGGRP